MPSTYSPELRIELIANGEQSGTWGSTTNSNLGTIIESAISGAVAVSVTSASQALTALNGAPDQARNAVIDLTTTTTAPFNVYIPPSSKLYVVRNSSAYAATIYCSTVLGNTTAAGTGVVIPAGKTCMIWTAGANVTEQLNHIVGAFSTTDGLAVGGSTTVAGTLAVAGDAVLSKSLTVANSAFLGGSQTATISVATPTVITVASAPASGSTVTFSTTGVIPTGLTVGTTYYVSNINSTTFNISTSSTLSPLVAVSGAGSGTHTVINVSLAVTPPATSNSTQIATTEYVTTALTNVPTLQTKTAVKVATTQSITLSGAQTIDGVSVVAGDRVLVKDQLASSQTATITIATPGVVTVGSSISAGTKVIFSTTGALPTGLAAGVPYYVLATGTSFSLAYIVGGPAIATSGTQSGTHTLSVIPAAANGVYIADASTWVRSTDMDSASEVAAASVPVLSGTVNGGKTFSTSFKSTDTLGSTVMAWDVIVSGYATPTIIGGVRVAVSGTTLNIFTY